jgi:tetratricopeptide (TPR) repeat protein
MIESPAMKTLYRSLPFLGVFLSLCIGAYPQTRGHKLYGDLRVDERALTGLQSRTFLVSLVTISGAGAYGPGNVIDRLQVPANGRYQFLAVPNGEYELVIERENVEVGRMRFIIQEQRFTDIRRDITLQWSPDMPKKAEPQAAPSAYLRTPDQQAAYQKAQEAMQKNAMPQAAGLLEKLTNADPKDFEAWTELGTVCFRQERLADAEKAYQRALEESPSFLPALLNLGKLRIAQKNPDGAVEILTKAVQVHPGSSDAQYLLGESYLQIKKGSKAVGYLNEAIRLDPIGKADAHLRLASLYNGAGMKDRAAAEYEQFLAKKPDYADKKKLEQYIKDNKKQ